MENLAVILAIGYLLLAIRQNILCWICATLSTSIYIYLFFNAKLYMESLLNLFYFFMAIYGWISWSSKNKNEILRISQWTKNIHILAITIITSLSLLMGFLLSLKTDAAFPYIDSMTTFFSIWATYLVAKKILENWWYWLVIDLVSMMLYWSRDLQMTSLLFLLYIFMIPFGMYSWKKSFEEHSNAHC